VDELTEISLAGTTIDSTITTSSIFTTGPTITTYSTSSLITSDPSTTSSTPTFTCDKISDRESQLKIQSPWPFVSYESVKCCDGLHRQWSEASSYQASEGGVISSWLERSFATRHFTVAKCDGPFTTLCDGVTRAMCSPPTPQPALELLPMSFWISSQTSAPPSSASQFAAPHPNCTIASEDCDRLWGKMADDLEVFNKNHGMFDGTNNLLANYSYIPDTEPDSQRPNCPSSNDGTCLICGFHNETVQMLYWNVEVDESLLCKPHNFTKTTSSASSSSLVTAIWKSFTLTSPTVYGFYTMMRDELGCGSPHTDVMVPIDPLEVSTMVFRSDTDTLPFVSRVNFQHLAYKTHGSLSYPLVPRSAYCADHRQILLTDPCNTIYHDYRPGVVFRIAPEVLRSIDPAWKYCRSSQFMAFDPPIILRPAETVSELPQASIRPSPASTATLPPFPEPTQAEQYPQVTSAPQVSEDRPLIIPNDPPIVTVSFISLITSYAPQIGMGGLLNSAGGLDSGIGGSRFEPNDIGYLQSSSFPIDNIGSQRRIVFSVLGQTLTAERISSNAFQVGGSMVIIGQNPITLNGVAISAFSGGVVASADTGRISGSAPQGSVSINDETKTTAHRELGTSTTKKKNEAKGKGNATWHLFTICVLLSLLLQAMVLS
jgi:hypothetical protein